VELESRDVLQISSTGLTVFFTTTNRKGCFMGNIIQELYDAIKNWKAPAWLKTFISDLQTVLVKIAIAAGEAYIQYLEQKVIEAAGMDITPEAKFQFVFDAAKSSAIPALEALGTSELNTLIENIVSVLKSKGTIA
jgi:hypothetical protein